MFAFLNEMSRLYSLLAVDIEVKGFFRAVTSRFNGVIFTRQAWCGNERLDWEEILSYKMTLDFYALAAHF
ncbi:hypothetical protein CGJ21_13335 [Vibrio parahaemolyticus]|nr:hypothetical protein [Vibrio parahaemolyticus]EGR3166275.1 hypothetical protein [Vibrio parahaemolyticus]EGR3209889.1 hypothetical protein [Vibrio parahaemolyticus]EGR3468913.1 hypothetical protein [Vibrio parahaemolyticus]EGR3520281.1 hypothetical protein [Vibrio parahaemolyticus]